MDEWIFLSFIVKVTKSCQLKSKKKNSKIASELWKRLCSQISKDIFCWQHYSVVWERNDKMFLRRIKVRIISLLTISLYPLRGYSQTAYPSNDKRKKGTLRILKNKDKDIDYLVI